MTVTFGNSKGIDFRDFWVSEDFILTLSRYSKIRSRLQLRTLNDFMLTHISRHTSTIMASCFSDPALAYFPCSGVITRDKWTAA
jgi:hypothetical protein